MTVALHTIRHEADAARAAIETPPARDAPQSDLPAEAVAQRD